MRRGNLIRVFSAMEIVVEVLDLWDIYGFLSFQITTTCRCDTTWTSTAGTTNKGYGPFFPNCKKRTFTTRSKTLELANIHSPLYCLDGWCLALYRRWNIRAGKTNNLTMYWTCEAVTVWTPKSDARVTITTDVLNLGTCFSITTGTSTILSIVEETNNGV